MQTADELIAFERDIAAEFEAGNIRAPVHLAGGNEEQLITIFGTIRPQDWVLTTWRSHYHCLLKGVPPEEVKAAILAGKSITLNFPEHRVLSSAIVGGICPIAVGLAASIKSRGLDERVFCFIGDMTARSGIAYESFVYSSGHDLPVVFVIEDNFMSVKTNTADVWGRENAPNKMLHYGYTLAWPHVGIGKWVSF